jgi:hypothetical protein
MARLLKSLILLSLHITLTGCCLVFPIPFLSSSGSGLQGLYVGTESRQDFNPATGYYDYKVRQIYYIFYPDGRVYYGLPKGGALDSFDYERARSEDPKNCGTFQINGDQIQFNWPATENNGQNQTIPFKSGRNSIQIGKTTFYSVGKFDGLHLDGAYAAGSFANTSNRSLGTTGGVGSEQTIILSSDGNFNQNGFIGFAGSTEDVGSTASESTTGSGTYNITGNTLALNYSDGRTQQFTFFVYPENVKEERPGLIVIDGRAFLLQKE